jgi:dTDP-4-amino-4,6-dideoxygalactose transaminase
MLCYTLIGGNMKQTIINAIDDTVSSFLYYDRKEDEELPRGAIEEAIKSGEITYGEIIDRFKQKIYEGLDV